MIDSEIWQSLAARNGCKYVGHQRFHDGLLYAQFTDSVTGSTFTKGLGETIGEAVTRVRRKHGKEASCRISLSR